MNAIWIVLPILTLLMFELGLNLKVSDFLMFTKRPRPIILGLIGQLIALPVIAFALGVAFNLDPLFFIGFMLIATCPGGSSSNVFSLLAKGDVALSVSLTACSSILTLFTIPVIMDAVMRYVDSSSSIHVDLPMGKLIVQNLALMLAPILAGIAMKRYVPNIAEKLNRILSKLAFPALMFLAAIFFVQHKDTIIDNFGQLAVCVCLLISLGMAFGYFISKGFGLNQREQKTLIIEIGMQNAAQAIAVASSPFVFNNNIIAIPAIIYALFMNIILLIYVAVVKRQH